MKKNKHLLTIIIGSAIVIGVAVIFYLIFDRLKVPTVRTFVDSDLARIALVDYLDALHTGDFETAATLYGGSYETLIAYNPDLDPSNHAALLERACTMNGFQCLQAAEIQLDDTKTETLTIFSVTFQNAQGALFELGPCCGADDTDSPPKSEFSFEVSKVDSNHFLVMDLPPYLP